MIWVRGGGRFWGDELVRGEGQGVSWAQGESDGWRFNLSMDITFPVPCSPLAAFLRISTGFLVRSRGVARPWMALLFIEGRMGGPGVACIEGTWLGKGGSMATYGIFFYAG